MARVSSCQLGRQMQLKVLLRNLALKELSLYMVLWLKLAKLQIHVQLATPALGLQDVNIYEDGVAIIASLWQVCS